MRAETVREFNAIAAIEFDDIAVGMYATDAMLKRAPIGLVKSGTISHGRFLTLIAGSTASVDESFREGLALGKDSVVDSVILMDVHHDVRDAVLGKRGPCHAQSTAIIETPTVSSNIRAAETALKGTDVRLIEIRMADSLLAGKGLSIYQGNLHEVQSAVELAEDLLKSQHVEVRSRIIPAPHEGFIDQIETTTSFRNQKLSDLDGESA